MNQSYALELDDVEQRNRLTTLFRSLIVIPHLVLSNIYNFAAALVTLVAWFALLFTGRWPEGMYNFVCGAVRFQSRVQAYAILATDPFPPFDTEEHPEYPLRVTLAPPKESYNRLKVFFRGIYTIPALIVVGLLGIVVTIVMVFDWLAILITGKQVQAFQNLFRTMLEWSLRYHVLSLLIAEDY